MVGLAGAAAAAAPDCDCCVWGEAAAAAVSWYVCIAVCSFVLVEAGRDATAALKGSPVHTHTHTKKKAQQW